ncbi:MAG: cytochrome C oxidase subunit IV family protein [Anaerolineae bacterium]|nr:cytochrome C oxidase subunit IV family protein [Anaerolineae bacterium]
MEHHVLPLKTYLIVFALLIVLAVLTVVAAFLDFGPLTLPIAMTIAVTKAVLVILYFMHIRYSERLLTLFAIVGFFFLLIMITFTLGDFIARDGAFSSSVFAVPFDETKSTNDLDR